jgi:hypothetical protein
MGKELLKPRANFSEEFVLLLCIRARLQSCRTRAKSQGFSPSHHKTCKKFQATKAQVLKSLRENLPVEFLSRPRIRGCPTSRSFFARCGIPRTSIDRP